LLTLEIELLTGVYRASLPDGSAAEWPPHPERVFSAFVQAWGDGELDEVERDALEWLEAQDLPAIEAAEDVSHRDSPTVYVPPNDVSGENPAALPDRRVRKARDFHAVLPQSPIVRLRWEATPPVAVLQSLHRLAQRVSSLGHSASLVRFQIHDQAEPGEREWKPDPTGSAVLRAPYDGRLTDLERWYADDGKTKRRERPRTRRYERYRPPRDTAERASPARSVFGAHGDWFVFEDAGGFRPDLLAFAHVARRMRDALMSRGPQPPPEVVSGHTPDRAPSLGPHLAILPLANVGWSHATGDLLGFAAVLPRDLGSDDRAVALRCLASFVEVDADRSHGRLNLAWDRVWFVERTVSPSRASLSPQRWCASSSAWASVTPVFLDRFPDGDDAVEEAHLIAAACRNIGLPEPVEIEIHKHSAVGGAPSAYPARGSRNGPDWSFPAGAAYRDRPRRHVVLRFADAVEGPVVLGAARFHGLGMFLPFDAR